MAAYPLEKFGIALNWDVADGSIQNFQDYFSSYGRPQYFVPELVQYKRNTVVRQMDSGKTRRDGHGLCVLRFSAFPNAAYDHMLTTFFNNDVDGSAKVTLRLRHEARASNPSSAIWFTRNCYLQNPEEREATQGYHNIGLILRFTIIYA